jgi:hypothetical protein
MELVELGDTFSKGGGPIKGDERHTHFHSPEDMDNYLTEVQDQPELCALVRLAALPQCCRSPGRRACRCAIAGGRCDSGACRCSAS